MPNPFYRTITQTYGSAFFPEKSTKLSLKDIEPTFMTALLVYALRRARGSKMGAAKLLGLNRMTIYHWMDAYKVSVEECANGYMPKILVDGKPIEE